MNNKTSVFVNSVFEQPWWLDVVAANTWKEIIVEEEGEVVARWPIIEERKAIVMPELNQTLGFWISEKIVKSDTCYNKRKKIINLLLDNLPTNKDIDIKLDSNVDYFLPFYWRHFEILPRISYRYDDLSNLNILYSKTSTIVKDNIKRAKNKVTIKSIDDIEILLMLLDQTFYRQNAKNPYRKDLIRKIYHKCKEHDACYLLYAIDKNGIARSGNLVVYDKNVCYNLLSGTDPTYRSSGAQTLLVWESIKLASKVSKSFDFEGSMVEGIENFLRQFGGTPVVYYQIKRQKQSIFKKWFLKISIEIKQITKSLVGYNNRYKNMLS